MFHEDNPNTQVTQTGANSNRSSNIKNKQPSGKHTGLSAGESLLPQLDAAALAGRNVALVTCEVHNPRPPSHHASINNANTPAKHKSRSAGSAALSNTIEHMTNDGKQPRKPNIEQKWKTYAYH